MVGRRILRWDVNRVVWYLGCLYASNRRYADVGPVVVVIKPGVARHYMPVRGAGPVTLPW